MTPGKINSNDNSSNVDVPTSSSEGKDETQTIETIDTKKSTTATVTSSTCDISSTTDKNENETKADVLANGVKSDVNIWFL